MQTKDYKTIDKTSWNRGPWDNEPDKVQWQDEVTGMPCLAVRHKELGHWCGYVGVTEDHPAFEKDYNDVDASVHGGLTFADKCQPEGEERSICHVPDPGESDDVWWFGFDCAHMGDASPGMDRRFGLSGTYKTLKYVKSECADLAEQLKDQA